MTSVVYLTKKGMKELRKAISRLEQDKSQLVQSLKESDHTTKREDRLELNEKLAQLEAIRAEIADKQHLLQNAKQIPKRQNRLTVAVGSVVELLDRQGKRLRYTLVESVEADPSQGKISISSPLGRSLVGKRIREVVQWSTGQGKRQMTLINIR